MTYKPSEEHRQQIESMVGLGITHRDIAKIMGVTIPTLNKYYKAEMKLGAIKANIRVANRLYKLATRENASAAACIYWTKVRMGWKEPAPDRPLGKKEQQEADALHAEKGTRWAGLLN